MMLAGFYEKEITPPIGGHMPGSFDARYSTGVKDEKLMVKAAAFELNNERVVIVAADVLYLSDEMVDAAVKKINEYIGVPEKNILIQAMHCHTAGPIYSAKEGQVPRNEMYVAFLKEAMADCAILAFHRMIPVTAKFAKTRIPGLTFLRNYLMKDGNVRTNPDAQSPDVERPFGTADDEFMVMFFFDEEGNPIHSITNFACHHCVANCPEYCADYSAVLAKDLKKHFGMDYINLMISGTSGNLNHFDFFAKDWTRGATKTPRYVQMGKVMAETVIKLFDKAKQIALDDLKAEKEVMMLDRRYIPKEEIEEAEKLIKEIPFDSMLKNFDNLAESENIAFKRAKASSIIAVAETSEKLPAAVQAIRIGECAVYAFSGEPFCEFGISVKAGSPSKYSMVASVANGATRGYIPTKETFGTAIYESQIGSAKFNPDAGYKMVEKAIELAKKMY